MKVIITGTTGMVGEGVLLECLANPNVTEVLSVSRKHNGIKHPKLKEYIVTDFLELIDNDPNLQGYDACFFCAGISSIGLKVEEYKKITYDTTLAFARALLPANHLTFIYVSGAGTDSSEKGNIAWARIKGKTENDLSNLPFKQVFAFRPAALVATKGQIHLPKLYKYAAWIFPMLTLLSPNYISTLQQLGKAMINILKKGSTKKVIEVKDINSLASI